VARRGSSERTKDRIAAAVIRCGGGLVVLLVAVMVLGITLSALPLFLRARLAPPSIAATGEAALAVGFPERSGRPWSLDARGVVREASGAILARLPEVAVPLRAAVHEPGGLQAALDASGLLTVGRVRAGRAADAPGWQPLTTPLALDPEVAWLGLAVAAGGDDDELAVLVWSAARTAAWSWREGAWSELALPPGGARAAALAEGLATAALVRPDGALELVRLPDGRPEELGLPPVDVALVCFLDGGRSLLAASDDGALALLQAQRRVEVRNGTSRSLRLRGVVVEPGARLVVPDDGVGRTLAHRDEVEIAPAAPQWRVVRRPRALGARPIALAAADRSRGFAVAGADGSLAVYNATTGSRRVATMWPIAPLSALAMAPRGTAVAGLGPSGIAFAGLDDPHSEVSLRTLLLPRIYEGYARPRLVWQTSGGDDSFERKLSVTPLILGTLKATAYAMLVAVPLALLAAVYVSQLAPPRLQAVVKPAVELMAAVPSVVVGFLAALWLAPRLEAFLLPALMSLVALPAVVLLALLAWRVLPPAFRRRTSAGIELGLVAAAAAAVLAVVWWVAGPLERLLFGGDLTRWLFAEWGLRYDQRNALVVGVALGFAVIPVIFTVAEDACSSVPRSLTHAARALGATRWQAATRMVLPAASPGLFAAVFLGFGRAVGETMIVLMASGNTALTGLGPFDGMRTMAAAIAVEIPEAAIGTTHYRVLFVTGLLLFAFSFAITTAAGAVGRALRSRYARF
jgi:ABC-type uncharacterized transport system permease subunit